MSDLRARLTDALRERFPWMDYEGDVADVLLSLPGIAIVELPTESWPNDLGVSVGCEVMASNSGHVWVGTDLDLSAEYARTLAAALLAAAAVAEVH